MYRNGIEDEFRLQTARLAECLRDRDRGVLLGLLFCLIPLPPVNLAGIVITVINLRLIARGRVPPRERRLVWISLAVGLTTLLIGVTIFAWLATIVLRLPEEGAQLLRWMLNQVLGAAPLPALPQGMRRI